MTVSSTGVLLLSGGLSRRFGGDNKLLAAFGGKPLAGHAAQTLSSCGFAHLMAVVPPGEAALRSLYRDYGFGLVETPAPENGQAESLACGIRAFANLSVSAVLVALADMPLVPASHFRALAEALGEGDAAASVVAGRRQPPVIFSSGCFEALSRLTGDRGGREVLVGLANVMDVPLAERLAVDIDTPADLDRCNRDCHDRDA